MTPPQSTAPTDHRPDPWRWDRQRVAQACDDFRQPDRPASQRQYARDHGLPRATLGSWLRQPDPDGLDPALVAFLRSAAGLAFLRRLVLALFVVFLFRGGCGLRLLGTFLHLCQLDRFVASSYGALHSLGQRLEADLGAFADEERPRLAQGMTPRAIAACADENFHSTQPCLVAIEPLSNFLLVEQYSAGRDGLTWTTVLEQAVTGLPVQIVVLTSDQAKGLLACAKDGLQAQHLPELFHGQRDLGRALAGPLQRQVQAAQKASDHAEQVVQHWRDEAAAAAAGPARPGRGKDFDLRLDLSQGQARWCGQQLQEAQQRQQQASAAVRGLADDFHPFDSQTGAAVPAGQLEQRLGQRLQTVEQVVQAAGLGSSAQEALAKGRRWVTALVAALAWYWAVVRQRLEELGLAEEAERAVSEQLLPGLYWQQAARRGRTADERRRCQELARRLLGQAWRRGGALSRLDKEQRDAVARVGRELVGLFARSSSCVEGRNGQLSLLQHGQARLSGTRLKALTAVHNYVSERPDGTTAAERFFGQKPRDVFGWLLQRLPELPRPATKRPRKGDQAAPKAA
jgi:hypothetical protein